MTGKTKLSYLAAIIAIIIPSIIQWERAILIPKKEALLPPKLPLIAKKNEQLLTTLLARNLWDKNHQKISDKSTHKVSEEIKDTSTEWVLQGITVHYNATPSIEIVTNMQQSIVYLGETLPDNWKLKAIFSDNILITKKEETRHVYLFGKQ